MEGVCPLVQLMRYVLEVIRPPITRNCFVCHMNDINNKNTFVAITLHTVTYILLRR